MTIMEQINDGIKEAMRNKNQVRLDTLRMLKSKILVVDARGNVDDSEIQKLFKTYLGNLQETLEIAQKGNRTDVIEKVKQEILIVQEFLPKALSEEATKKLVDEAIASSGAKTKRDLGLVMKALMQLNSSIDGKLAKDLASQQLGD